VDILAGALYEFRNDVVADRAAIDRLPQLVAHIMKEDYSKDVQSGEAELQQVVLQLAATGGGWPDALRQRLLAALDGPCKVTCSSQASGMQEGHALPSHSATKMAVDSAFTSPGTVSVRSSWLHQKLLNIGAATGIPVFRKRAAMYKSRPADVVISAEPIAARDCFALRGNASVALRVAGSSGNAVIRQVVVDQLPHWVAPKLRSLPGRFEVWGAPSEESESSGAANPYSVPLGSFQYVAAGPAAQAFELKNPLPVRGLLLSFEEPADSAAESFFCIYRLRAFESKQPSCTEATAKAPARMVMPARMVAPAQMVAPARMVVPGSLAVLGSR